MQRARLAMPPSLPRGQRGQQPVRGGIRVEAMARDLAEDGVRDIPPVRGLQHAADPLPDDRPDLALGTTAAGPVARRGLATGRPVLVQRREQLEHTLTSK